MRKEITGNPNLKGSASFAVFLRLLVKLKHAGIAFLEAAPKRHGNKRSKKRNVVYIEALFHFLPYYK